MARPSDFNQTTADEICERLVDGESLRGICEDEDMPAKSTVLRWALVNEVFRDQYADARELSGETDADDVAHYARQAAIGRLEPQAANVAINGLKWSAAQRQPKKYGNNVQVRHADADGGKLPEADPAATAARIAAILAAGQARKGEDEAD